MAGGKLGWPQQNQLFAGSGTRSHHQGVWILKGVLFDKTTPLRGPWFFNLPREVFRVQWEFCPKIPQIHHRDQSQIAAIGRGRYIDQLLKQHRTREETGILRLRHITGAQHRAYVFGQSCYSKARFTPGFSILLKLYIDSSTLRASLRCRWDSNY